MRVTAAVLYEQGLPRPYVDSEPFKIEDVELEGPGDGEVLVEVRAAGSVAALKLPTAQAIKRRD
jgi:alcohol dehydrogenase